MKLVLYAIAIFILLYMLAVLNRSHMHSDNLSRNGRAHQASSSSELKINIGYEWARQLDIRSHARCREQWTDENHEPYERTGCSKYVSEAKGLNNLPPIPKHAGWDDGTTTAKCSADMHAYWDPLLQDMLERGDDMAYSARQRDLRDELRQCENFDHIRIGRNTQRVTGADEDQEQHDRLQAPGVGMSKYEFRESQRRAFKKIEERTNQRNQESADRLTEHEYTAE